MVATTYSRRTTSTPRHSRRSWILIAGGVVAVIIVIIGTLELTNTTHWLHKAPTVSGTIPSTSPEQTARLPKSNSSDAATGAKPIDTAGGISDNKANAVSTTPSGPIDAPYGTFISNHHPSLSGKSSPSSIQSVCLTTPGADCFITFTQGSIVKTLEAKTANRDGTVYWDWDIAKAGFSTGTWKVVATAKSGDQSKQTSDPLDLEVNP
jgi:hypothetical protein